jgi:hypothetical protein
VALTKIPANLLDTSSGFDLQGNITLGDNEQIQLGASSDLQIYHDGINSYIKEIGPGALVLQSAGPAIVLEKTDGENMLLANVDGAVTLYYNGSAKIATTSTGATVTGNLAVTGDLDITGDINSYNVTDLDVTDQTITLGAGQTEANSGGSGIIIDGSSASILWDETNDKFDLSHGLHIGDSNAIGDATTPALQIGGTTTYRLGMYTTAEGAIIDNANGDDGIIFHTKNANEAMRIDASGNVGIGTDSPSQILHVKAASPNILLEGTNYPSLKWAGTDLTADAEIYYGVGGLDWNFNNYNNGRIVFKTNNTERLRIDSSGDLLVNQTSAGVNGKLQVTGGIGLTGNSEIRQSTNSDGSTLRFLGTQFVAGSSNAVGYSYSSGALIASVSNSANVTLFEAGASNTSGHRLTVQNDATGLQGEVKYTGSEPVFILRDTRNVGGTGWSSTADEHLGEIQFWTSDGTGVGPHSVARIKTVNDITAASPAGRLSFFTSQYNDSSGGWEKMRIASNGPISMYSGSVNTLQLNTSSSASGTNNLIRAFSDSNIDSGGTVRFVVFPSGNVQNSNNSYGQISDETKKENIVDATDKLDALNQVRVRNFNFIGDDLKQIGVVAQELETIFPSMVEDIQDQDAEGNVLETSTKSVKYSVFVPILIKAIQEQQTIIEDLKSRIETLEG